jgi:hypothetical protein
MARTLARIALITLAITTSSTRLAHALTQPNGTVIPTGMTALPTLFAARGEGINAITDAAITPETFTPACALTFTVLQRLANDKNAFGWYNVTGAAPTNGQLHEVLSCNDAVGTQRTVDIRNDPGYTGGEIGFYEATGSCATSTNHTNLFFSQRALNPDGSGANATIHLITYNSTVTPRAFYFAWEDLLAGGDNDFDDLTTFVTGINCSGGGAACDTGRPGVCADGTRQCQSGTLQCVQTNPETDEICDGLDNDCDGMIDDAVTCPDDGVCDRGVCVPRCGSTEFPCNIGQVCNAAGLCIDESCANLPPCPVGQRCEDGACVEPCGGVTCPHGQVCRVGGCVDPCAGLACDASQVCIAGVCQDRCECSGCGASQTCQAGGTGECLANACLNVHCPAGQFCATDGTCKDACEGATCPSGQVCEAGACVAAPPPPDAGPLPPGPPDAAPPPGSPDASTPVDVDAGHGPPANGSSGCGCRAAGRAEGGAGGAVVALGVLLLAFASARRRRPGSRR